jgi:hypothetical protein
MILIGFAHTIAGRTDKAGTAAAAELLIPIGARSIALGNSPLSTISGVEAMYWNPAGLARTSMTGVMFSHMRYIADINVNYFAAGTFLNNIGSIGIAVKSLDVGDISVTTEDQPDGTGEVTSPTFVIVGATFARQITDRISVGITSNYIYEKMAKVSASSYAFNFGVQYMGIGGIDGLSVGAAVKNIGPSLKYDGEGLLREAGIFDAIRKNSIVKIQAAASDLPSTIEIGLGYSMLLQTVGKLNFTSVFQNNNYSADEYKFGVEYIFNGLLSLRSGIAIAPEGDLNENIFGQSVGAGIHTKLYSYNISIDYAYRAVKYFQGNHVFCISFEY